ncbi:hypothetical protein THAOC_01990, partial [Thalassiosira oceanica]
AYGEGTEVEVDGIIFQCQPYPYSFYCTRYAPSPGQEGRWTDAWSEVGPCSRGRDESRAESAATTPAPTFRTTTPGPTDALVLTSSPTAAIEKSPPALPVETPPPAGDVQTDPAVPAYPVKRFVSMRICPSARFLDCRFSSSIPLYRRLPGESSEVKKGRSRQVSDTIDLRNNGVGEVGVGRSLFEREGRPGGPRRLPRNVGLSHQPLLRTVVEGPSRAWPRQALRDARVGRRRLGERRPKAGLGRRVLGRTEPREAVRRRAFVLQQIPVGSSSAQRMAGPRDVAPDCGRFLPDNVFEPDSVANPRPTTPEPTSSQPTLEPSSARPTTSEPTSSQPTSSPVTAAPTTSAPVVTAVGPERSLPPYPVSRYTQWAEMSDDAKTLARTKLSYNRYTWDTPRENDVETWAYYDLYASEVEAVDELGIGEESWDCWVNHYAGLFWSTLEERGLEKYYTALGWTAESWEGDAEKPATEDLYWDELSLDQQNAATNLCYFKNLWNQDPIGVWQFDVDEMTIGSDTSTAINGTQALSQNPVSTSTATQIYGAIFPKVRFVSLAFIRTFADFNRRLITWDSVGQNEVESYIYDDLYEREQAGLEALQISKKSWDCWVNHYSGLYWEDLVALGLDRPYSILGWDERSWSGDADAPPTDSLYWAELTPQHQIAASELCFIQEIWDEVSIVNWNLDEITAGVSSLDADSGSAVSLAPISSTTSAPFTSAPSYMPSGAPVTASPTRKPSRLPTMAPVTSDPTATPSYEPTTRAPSESPIAKPTRSPSDPPSEQPTREPTMEPSTQEPTSMEPTSRPTGVPTLSPVTNAPTLEPTDAGNLSINPATQEEPGVRFTEWSRLSESQRAAAQTSLGYDRSVSTFVISLQRTIGLNLTFRLARHGTLLGQTM